MIEDITDLEVHRPVGADQHIARGSIHQRAGHRRDPVTLRNQSNEYKNGIFPWRSDRVQANTTGGAPPRAIETGVIERPERRRQGIPKRGEACAPTPNSLSPPYLSPERGVADSFYFFLEREKINAFFFPSLHTKCNNNNNNKWWEDGFAPWSPATARHQLGKRGGPTSFDPGFLPDWCLVGDRGWKNNVLGLIEAFILVMIKMVFFKWKISFEINMGYKSATYERFQKCRRMSHE